MTNEYGSEHPRELEGRYVNYFEIGHNEIEFVPDFGQLYSEAKEPSFHTTSFQARETIMAVTIEDVTEAAVNGVLRALDARKSATKSAAAQVEDLSPTVLVRSGFYVDVHIIAGGYPPGPVWSGLGLNPQPLPPARQQ
jgi:hypothetical protein